MDITDKLLESLCIKCNMEDKEGYANTYIDEIKFFRISSNKELTPLLYSKGFIFIGQGVKRGIIGDKEIIHTNKDYLMVTSTQPIECETCIFEERPMLGLYINLNMKKLHKVTTKLNEIYPYNPILKKHPHSVVCDERTEDIKDVYLRILKALQDKTSSKMLGASLIYELYFRILQNNYGYILQQLCEQGSSFSRISKVVEDIHKRIHEKISVEEMAELAGMSPNNFHKVFKEALNETPVQYIKKTRLNKARQLILHENRKAIEASEAVGYDSATQFSREFKRYFGVTPGKIGELGYTNF